MTNKLIHKGNLIELHNERVELPNGDHTYFDIVKHPGGAVVAAINHNDEICLLKQWRHAVGEYIWELPAGCLEPDEPPLETAKRELEEETGTLAKEWRSLGKIVSSPGFCNEVLHLYEARGLSRGQVNLDDAEQLEPYWLPLNTAYEMCDSATITDAKTLSALLRLRASK